MTDVVIIGKGEEVNDEKYLTFFSTRRVVEYNCTDGKCYVCVGWFKKQEHLSKNSGANKLPIRAVGTRGTQL